MLKSSFLLDFASHQALPTESTTGGTGPLPNKVPPHQSSILGFTQEVILWDSDSDLTELSAGAKCKTAWMVRIAPRSRPGG